MAWAGLTGGGLALISLASCGQSVAGNRPGPSEPVASAPSPAPPAASKTAASAAIAAQPTQKLAQKLVAGEYCFTVKTSTLDGSARFTLDEGDRVVGTSSATIQNQEQGYYSSYTQNFSGMAHGDDLRLTVITHIENDVQTQPATWKLTATGLEAGRESYTRINCSALNAKIAGSARAATPAAAPVAGDALSLRSGPITFAPGRSSATVKSGVVRGDRNTYQLNARAGQTMTISITSLENNAVFDLIAPDGTVLKQETMDWSGGLPANGDYTVIVGGTRGNATFEMRVSIK